MAPSSSCARTVCVTVAFGKIFCANGIVLGRVEIDLVFRLKRHFDERKRCKRNAAVWTKSNSSEFDGMWCNLSFGFRAGEGRLMELAQSTLNTLDTNI